MTTHYYRVIISYKGSNYFGWQDLGDGGVKPTVQFEILKALRKICGFADCIVAGASRTDGGVHAQGQVAKLSIPLQIDADKLQLGLNSLLPNDIRILSCQDCGKEFNPNKDCTSKLYRYYFSIDEVSTPVLSDIVAHVPLQKISGQSRSAFIERTSEAGKAFIGQHDFCSFAAIDKSTGSTVRTINEVKLLQSTLSELCTTVYYFEIEGSGFLKHMIRYIVAAAFEVGRENIQLNSIVEALKDPSQKKLSPKAKSKGLHLIAINY